MRVFLANVGANSSHRHLFSPLFEDGTFEFLPIPEGDSDPDESDGTVRYRDLRSHYDPGRNLLQYVPQELRNSACHNDPDFSEFTYGDSGINGRSSALTQMRKGDVLLFLARLDRYIGGERTPHSGFYLVGGLVADHAGFISPDSPERDRLADNAHVLRGDAQFFGITGSDRSRRFQRAVPITREICDRAFRDKDGNKWSWGNGKSELSRIGSYTRSCRKMLDTDEPEEAGRTATLRAWIEEHSGKGDAELLAAGKSRVHPDATLYSYTVAHDDGFAPNPFHGFCTLACCKPGIRRTAKEGDYIIGLGPKRLGNPVVFAMRVNDVVEFEDYWHEARFRIKRPDMRAGCEKAAGDNIYHRGPTGEWQQEWSLHSLRNGEQDWKKTRTDTGGEKVLIGEDFIYWGGDGPPLPDNLQGLIVGRGYKSTANHEYIPDFIQWFEDQKDRGCLGQPTNGLLAPSNKGTARRRKRC